MKKTKEICIFLLAILLLLSFFHVVRDIINKKNPIKVNITKNEVSKKYLKNFKSIFPPYKTKLIYFNCIISLKIIRNTFFIIKFVLRVEVSIEIVYYKKYTNL